MRSTRPSGSVRRISRPDRRHDGHLALGNRAPTPLPLSCEFQEAYPDIGLRLLLTDRVLNPLETSIDVSIRIGPLRDSSLIATRVGSVRVVACASPNYLAARGRPLTPAHLIRHDCITIDEIGVPRSWSFMEDGQEIVAPIRSRLTVSTSEAAVEAAIRGAGLTRVCLIRWRRRGGRAPSSSCSRISRRTRCRPTSSMRNESLCRSNCAYSLTG